MKKAIIILVFLLIPVSVFAAVGIGAAGEKLSGMSGQGVTLSSNLQGTTAAVITMIFYALGTIFMALMIYGGVVWAKSAGRDEEINRAKKIVIAAIVGLVVAMASYAITNFVLSNISSGGPAIPEAGGGLPACTGTCKVVTKCTADIGVAETGTDCPGDLVCCVPNE